MKSEKHDNQLRDFDRSCQKALNLCLRHHIALLSQSILAISRKALYEVIHCYLTLIPSCVFF